MLHEPTTPPLPDQPFSGSRGFVSYLAASGLRKSPVRARKFWHGRCAHVQRMLVSRGWSEAEVAEELRLLDAAVRIEAKRRRAIAAAVEAVLTGTRVVDPFAGVPEASRLTVRDDRA